MHRHSFVYGFGGSAAEFSRAPAPLASSFGKTQALLSQPETPALKTPEVYTRLS